MMVLTQVRRNGTVDMLIVLAEENIERIKQYDPAEIIWSQLPQEYSTRRPHTIAVTFATAQEQAEIERLSATDPKWKEKTFEMLCRGFEYRPEQGDHDFGPTLLGRKTAGIKH